MSEIFGYMEEIVDEARQHTDQLIANVSKSVLPYFVDLRYNFIRNARYRYNNETVKDEDHLILKVEGIRDKTFYVNRKEESIYKMNVWDAINKEVIHPFALFIDGKHVKWSDMTIVRDTRYTYLLLPKNPFKDRETQINKIKSVKCLYIPFNIFYTETRQKAPDSSYITFLRFSNEGDLVESGRVIYYLSHPNLRYSEYSFGTGYIRGHDLEIDHNYRLTEENFLVFRDRRLDTETEIYVNRMNLLFVNSNEDYKFKIKCFYRTDVNTPYNTINKLPNIDLAKSIAQGKVKSSYIDTKILNTDFNFSNDYRKSYDLNVRTGFRYITSYDTDFLSKVYEKTNSIETKEFTGKDIRDRVDSFGILKMLLLKYKKKDTKVIVFCNGNIYSRYSDIKYNMNSFTIPIDMTNLDDKDEFEFVFIKNINNYQEVIRYTEENRFKTQEPFEDDELLLYSQDTTNHIFKDKVVFNDRSWFPVEYEIKDGEVIIDEQYNDSDILYTTKNRFSYHFRYIQKETIKMRLSEEFKICTNQNQYLVFVNGRLLNREFYRVLIPSTNNVFTDPYIYTRVKLHPGDKVEVFYMPVEFKTMNYTGNLVTRVTSIYATKSNQLSFIVPYPFKLYTYRDDFMVYVDGVFVDPSRYKTKNGVMAFTDGTYLDKGTQLSFIFLYDNCSEQEAAIYINNDNGVYTEHIYLQVVGDGQTRFDLGEDRFIDYLMEGNGLMVLYHGMYVPSEYWTINRYTGILTFAPNKFKRNDFLTVILFHLPDELNQQTASVTINEDWKTIIDGSDLTGFPFRYTNTASFNDLFEWGPTNFINQTIEIAKKIIHTRNVAINGENPTEWESSDYSSASLTGIIKTETKVTASYDNQTEFDSNSITGFPVTTTNNKTFSDLTNMTEEDLIKEGAEMLEITLDKMDSEYFDISQYITEGRPIFIMKNSVLLTEGHHYTILREANKIKFMDPLMKGDKIYIISYTSNGRIIKSYEHDILVEDVNRLSYDLYDVFGKLDRAKCRFMIYIGSLLLDHRRYNIDDNSKLTFIDNKMFSKGQHIRIVLLYVDEETKSMYTYNYLGSSKYHFINQVEVEIERLRYTYDIPYPDDDYEAGFFIMAGGGIIDPSRYIVNEYDRTIKFKHTNDPLFEEYTTFKFVFMYDDMRTLSVETAMGDIVADRRRTYNIPVPFPNYFELGNNILAFAGSVLLDPQRYSINTEENLITLDENVRIEDQSLRYIFIFHSNNKNISYVDEDITIATIRKNGYIFMNKDNLEHPLSKNLFWMFINGKKVNLNDIEDVSTNVVKINKDQRSRYNLVLLSHTPKIDELDAFFKTYSNYDTLINNLKTEDLNQLFNSHRLLSDTEVHYDMDVTKEAIVTEIARDWFGRTGIYAGNSFNNTYEDITRTTDQALDKQTKEVHSMVADASQYFSARLDRSKTNIGITER